MSAETIPTTSSTASAPLSDPGASDREAAVSSPFALLMQLSGGYCVARSLHVLAEIGVADALDETARSGTHLAGQLGVNAEALTRVMRLVASFGVFADRHGSFVHTPASRLLRSDHPQSLRAFVRMIGMPVNWTAYTELAHSVRTGRPALEKTIPEGFFAYLTAHVEERRTFDEGMVAKSRGFVDAILAAYDFSRFRRIGDIGGSGGHLLRAVLQAAPRAEGVLFDLPTVIDRVVPSERLSLQPGDFFRDALPACDAYLLSNIIHDWDDAESVAILQAVRHAARPGAVLLVIELIVPPLGAGPSWATMHDIHMLALLTGRQRTEGEFQTLFAASGWRLARAIPTAGDVQIIEALQDTGVD